MTHLSIVTLGSLQISLDEQALIGFESDKVRALLIYLAMMAHVPQRRAVLVGLLWPDFPEKVARHNLSQALFNLRQVIGDHQASSPFLQITRQDIQLSPIGNIEIDACSFQSMMAKCREHEHIALDQCTECIGHMEQAIALYRGEFLTQFFLPDCTEFEAWAEYQRQVLHQQALTALQSLVDFYKRNNNYETAVSYLQQQLQLNPWQEEAHRDLMCLFVHQGNRNAALAQYDICYQTLAKDLSIPPAPETTALYDRIKDNQLIREDFGVAIFSVGVHKPSPVHHLPDKQTSFVGRQTELLQLHQLLSDPNCRLLSLVGPGGIGKTRLALEAVKASQNAFTDGVHFISLASLDSADNVVSAIAETLELSFYEGRNLNEQLYDYVKSKQLLLLFDNLEHLLPKANAVSEKSSPEAAFSATIALIVKLLETAANLKIVVTSRNQLPLQQGQLYRVTGLSLANKNRDKKMCAAVRLFHERVQRLQHNIDVSEEAVVHDICHLLRGSPLAIELAAALVAILPLEDILVEIRANLDVLATNSQDIESRHRSIRAVFDSSWQLLSTAEQIMFARLSIFRGGFTREAANEVAQAALSDLAGMVHKSLLQYRRNGRFEMHELMRQYAAQKLASMPAQQRDTQYCHAAYYGRFLQQYIHQWRAEHRLSMVDEVVPEIENIQAGLAWLFEQEYQYIEDLILYVNNLWHFYKRQSRLAEAVNMLKQAIMLIEMEQDAYPLVRAEWHYLLGVAYWGLGQLNRGYQHLQQSVRLLDKPIPTTNGRLLLGFMGQVVRQFFNRIRPWQSSPQKVHQSAIIAAETYEQTARIAYLANDMLLAIYSGVRAVNVAEQTSLSSTLATAYASMIIVCGSFRLHRFAEQYVRLAQEVSRKLDDLSVLGTVAIRHGIYCNGIGQWETAKRELEGAIDRFRRLEDWRNWGDCLSNLAYIPYFQGDFNGYRKYWVELHELTQTSHNAQHKAWSYTGQAQALIALGYLDEAVVFLEKAYPLLESVASARIGKIGYHTIFALAYLYRREMGAAEEAADKATVLLKQSLPFSYVVIYIYSELAEVYLTLLEQVLHDPNNEKTRAVVLKKKADRVCKILTQFAWIHPIARPYADLHRGQWAWLAGKKRRAHHLWQRSMVASHELEMRYIEGIANYEIGRHAMDTEGHIHLIQAREIFARLKTPYYLQRTEDALLQKNV